MRILWASNSPHATTAYAQQSGLTAQMLSELGAEVAFFATYRSSEEEPREWRGFPIFHSPDYQAPLYGIDRAATSWDADLIIFLGDPWAYKLDDMREVADHVQLATWFPLDTETIGEGNIPWLEWSTHVLTLSKHGTDLLEASDSFSSVMEIPHAVDPFVFYPRTVDRPEGFVVGMVQNNLGPRKLTGLQLRVLAEMVPSIPDLVIYMHMDIKGEAFPGLATDWRPLLKWLGLEDRTYYPDPYEFSVEDMAKNYNRMDVLLNTTSGEGFGVPVIEAMACGKPAITTRNSASQYINQCWQVEPVTYEFVNPLYTFYSWPSAAGIAAALKEAHLQPFLYPPDQLREHSKRYWRDSVRDQHWAPFLEQVEANVKFRRIRV